MKTTKPETIPLPRMHSTYAGGLVMGVMAGQDGKPDYLLIHVGNSPGRLTFDQALAWSKSTSGEDGPTRRELAMLFANRREGQFKTEWHWSVEPYAGDERYAWLQYFGSGGQNFYHEVYDYLAVAVRRVPFQ